MLKVLIADDEKNICLMIQKLVNWESYGMEVIGMVHNGLDAMEVIERQRPQLVISDIRMPGYDGLEIVTRTQQIAPDTDFVIISGYKQFEYAHTALNLGVEHYLLKPIDKQELENTLEKIRQKYQSSIQREEEETELRERVRKSRRKAQKHFLSTVLERGTVSRGLELEHVNTEYQCRFEQGCFVALLAKIDCEEPEQDLSVLLQSIENIIDTDLQDGQKEYINSILKSGVISILNYRPEDRADTRLGMEKPFYQIRKELDKFQNYHITIGIGNEKASISEIADSIREAVEAVKCRDKAGIDKIIYYDQLHYNRVPMEEILSPQVLREIENMTESLDYEALDGEIRRGLEKIKATAFFSPACVYDYIEHLEEIICRVLRGNQVREELQQQLSDRIQQILDFYYNPNDMIYQCLQAIRDVFEQVLVEQKSKGQLPIRQARQYIQEHYSSQVSLEDVAEAIQLSPAYLSTLFKKEMGINFSDYLISCRIEAAKDLLKNTDLPIAEVSEQVGYLDSRHFSKTFSKVVGLKPSAYRKLYR